MSRNRVVSFVLTLAGVCGSVFAAIPDGYYDDAIGLSGNELQQALATIINHTDPGYSSLWTIYQSTDLRDDGKIWDMYSATSNFTYGSDQCGTYSGEGDCYNREHSIPKSWVKGSEYSDAHIVVPTDGYINGRRGNYPFGEVGSTTYVSANSFSKVGTCTTSGYSGTVFEPNDEYKGDFARIYFYAATRYCNAISSWDNGENIFTTSFPHLTSWHKAMMLRWHQLDPVSQKEIDRNDAVYASKQKNRNPFVDHPELVDLIFGDKTTTAFDPDGGVSATPYITTPVSGTTLTMSSVQVGSYATKSVAVKGGDLTGNISLGVTGPNSNYFSLSASSLTASSVEAGVDVTITYTPTAAGTHTATLVISGGGLSSSVEVNLSATATASDVSGEFVALAATAVGRTSFVANWTEHPDATAYQLSVWEQCGVAATPTTLFDAAFPGSVASGWTSETGGFVGTGSNGIANTAIRLASGSKFGAVTSPTVDLSEGGELTVRCKRYSNDAAVLYILVDGEEVASIDCSSSSSEVTQTVTLSPATSASNITLKALSGKRVYLYSATLTTASSGECWDLLDEYPANVGNVMSYTVSSLSQLTTYRYQVVALSGASELEVSDYITVTTVDELSLTAPVNGSVINFGSLSLADGNVVKTISIDVSGTNITSDVVVTMSGSSYFTVSQNVIPAADVVAGTTVEVTYSPLLAGEHTATVVFANDEISAVNVTLTGSAYEDFKALEESELTNASFVANWTRHSQAIGYELAVWKNVVEESVQTDIFNVSFADGVPSGWSTSGYTNVENASIRMASGNNEGAVKSPAVDLSKGGELTVVCAPYKTTDNSILYILVDGVEVAQVDCSDGEVTQTVALAPATSTSTITFRAAKSSRVYFKSATLSVGTTKESWEMLDGYPLNVGDVTSYKVENLEITTGYRYQVTAIDSADEAIATSDYIELVTYELPTSVKPVDTPDFYVYGYNRAIYIDDAPTLSRVNVYSLDGTLCASRTVHSVREVMTMHNCGIYIVQIVTNQGSYTQRVAVL